MRIDQIHCSPEVEEAKLVLWGKHVICDFVSEWKRKGENLYSAYGQTDAGRYHGVLFIYKQVFVERPLWKALIISARDMTDTKHKQYERK